MVLWPFIDGHALDRNDPTQLRLAARLLATLHRTARVLTAPGPDPSATTYATRPAGPYSSVVPPDPDLDDWLCNWQDHRQADEPHGWMHGDFFDGNILCERQNTITGLIDWDDAQHGPLITELASALWEFACTPGRDTLTPERVQNFLTTYVHAGGPVRPSHDIIPLVRERLRNAITFFRRLQAHGHKLDHDNEQAMIAAFTSLRHMTISNA